MCFEIIPKKFLKLTCYSILVLLVTNLSFNTFKYLFYAGNYNDSVYYMIQMFDFNTERNIPTLFSVFLLGAASALLAFIAYTRSQLKQISFPWSMLSLLFLFLTIDEFSSFHERLSDIVNKYFEPTGLLYYSWVIPYGIVTLLIVLSLFKFLFTLPSQTKRLFIYSGLLFVTGAIGIEMLSGVYAEEHGEFNIFYVLIYSIEESFEMLGITLFIYALLHYIAMHFKSPTFKVAH